MHVDSPCVAKALAPRLLWQNPVQWASAPWQARVVDIANFSYHPALLALPGASAQAGVPARAIATPPGGTAYVLRSAQRGRPSSPWPRDAVAAKLRSHMLAGGALAAAAAGADGGARRSPPRQSFGAARSGDPLPEN